MPEKYHARLKRIRRQKKWRKKLRARLYPIDAGVLRPWQDRMIANVMSPMVRTLQADGVLPPGEFKVNYPATLSKEDWIELDFNLADVLRKQGMPAAVKFFFGDATCPTDT